MSSVLKDSSKINKRKSEAGTASSSSKKARTFNANLSGAKIHLSAKMLIEDINSDPESFSIPADDDIVRAQYIQLVKYASSLQAQVVAMTQGGAKLPPKEKSPDEMQMAVERLRRKVCSGIQKELRASTSSYLSGMRVSLTLDPVSLQWRATCKDNRARFNYDGVCVDPHVFGAMLKLDGPPTFKAKKMPKDDFLAAVGRIMGSTRYAARLYFLDVLVDF